MSQIEVKTAKMHMMHTYYNLVRFLLVSVAKGKYELNVEVEAMLSRYFISIGSKSTH